MDFIQRAQQQLKTPGISLSAIAEESSNDLLRLTLTEQDGIRF